ncbi:SDR family NAD(P)-dependent oxidoreductase [Chryseobacterium sp. MEBOG06]|uniref:SDR family NAD(P)-dependent oxidoreductase n=1 Tax=unclassified Chryseobacterium TaxID=2593645 RepID=UPI001F3D8BDF|nr:MULTISPECIES: SDR family NAD(P)-dependent oxidoreductase [unclassified Chryseobacterium]UKB84867.1 SDR family NAD(P)-dependent oxidoreductase [Chryseobacterium sp. MEBOG06]
MRKTIIITGATGGIGKAAAIALAKQGNDIIIQGRDAEKGKSISEEISKINGSTCQFIQANTSTMDGIKNLVAEVKKLTTKIDILIHSAGTLNSKRKETKESLDEVFVVNYLCKFMIDNLLLEELKKGGGRIIIVGGLLSRGVTFDFSDLQLQSNYSVSKRMGQNKLAVHMHAQEFAKKNGEHPSINVIHPGVTKTNIDRNLNWLERTAFGLLLLIKGNSLEKAIANILELASANKVESGYFYPKLADTSVREKINLDDASTAKLWEESLKIAKI